MNIKLKFGQRLTNLFSGATKGFGEIVASNSKSQSPKPKSQSPNNKLTTLRSVDYAKCKLTTLRSVDYAKSKLTTLRSVDYASHNSKAQIVNNKSQIINSNSSFRPWLQAGIDDDAVPGRDKICASPDRWLIPIKYRETAIHPLADGSSQQPITNNLQRSNISISLPYPLRQLTEGVGGGFPVECFPQFHYNNSTFSSITYFYLQAATAPPHFLSVGSRWPVYFWIRPGP